MEACGIPVEVSKGEWGPGQEEINVRYAEALEMADRHAIYKNGAKEIAFLHGQGRSPSWPSGLRPGRQLLPRSLSPCGTPASDRPLFADPDAPSTACLPSCSSHYLAGLLRLHAEP